MKKLVYILICTIILLTATLYWLKPAEFGRVQTLLSDNKSFAPQVVVRPQGMSYKNKTSFNIAFDDYDHYEIGFLFDDNSFPSSFNSSDDKYEFSGVIKLLLKCDDKIIVDEDIHTFKSYFYQKEDIKYIKEAILWNFSIPRGAINMPCSGEIVFDKVDDKLLKFNPSLFYALKGTP